MAFLFHDRLAVEIQGVDVVSRLDQFRHSVENRSLLRDAQVLI